MLILLFGGRLILIKVTRPTRCKVSNNRLIELEKLINENCEWRQKDKDKREACTCLVCNNQRIVPHHNSKILEDPTVKRYRWMPCHNCLQSKRKS